MMSVWWKKIEFYKEKINREAVAIDLTIFSDASLEGWGGTDQVTEIGG